MPFRTALCAAFLLFCAIGTRAEAQTIASSFDQLQMLVRPGDSISVRDSAGNETSGKIDSLSPTSLTLLTASGARELRESDVTSIRQRRGDSLKNGAIIGLVTGASIAAGLSVLASALDEGEVRPEEVAAIIVVYSGVGAAAGVGIDALIAKRQVIYQKPSRTSGITIAPLLAGGRRGAAISFGF